MTDDRKPPDLPLDGNLKYLKLPFMREQHHLLAKQAAADNWSHEDYLDKLADGEAALRKDRSTQRRVRLARFPVIKTLDRFDWTWPKKVNRLQVQQLFRLKRFGQIIIGPQFKPNHLVHQLPSGGKHNNRYRRILPDRLTHLKAVHIRQIDIQNNDIRQLGAAHVQGIVTPGSYQYFITLRVKVDAQQVRDVKVILNNE